MLLYTNTKVIIDPEGNNDNLEQAIAQIRTNARKQLKNNKIKFTFSDEGFPHFKNDNNLTFDQLMEVCQPDHELQFRAIGDESVELPMLRIKTIKHEFNEDERDQLATEMADAIDQADKIEANKKASASEFKAQLEIQQNLAREAGYKYRSGHELKDMEVKVSIDYNLKEKYYYDPKDGKLLETLSLEPADYQMLMKFEEGVFHQVEGNPEDEINTDDDVEINLGSEDDIPDENTDQKDKSKLKAV